MEEGDGEIWYCYYCVMKLHWKPEDYLSLSIREKLLIKVFIDRRLKAEEASNSKLKASSTPIRRR